MKSAMPFALTGRGLLALSYLPAYVFLDWISNVHPVLHLGIAPWNPQAGLTLVLLLTCGARYAVLTAVAVLVSGLAVRGATAILPVLMLASCVIASGYVVLARLLVAEGLHQSLESPRGILWFLTMSAVTTAVIAIAYVACFAAFGLMPEDEIFRSVRRYWLGDLSGILTLAPALLALPRWRSAVQQMMARRLEVLAQFAVVLLSMWIIFGLGAKGDVRLFYLLFLPIIWIAFRWGVSGTTLITLSMQLLLVMTARDEADYPPVIDLQLLMITLATTGLLLGAVVGERIAALRQVAAREAEQRAILNTAPDGIVSTDGAGRIVSLNPAAAALFARGELDLLGHPLQEYLPGFDWDAAQRRCSVTARRADGSTFPADISWAPFATLDADRAILVIRDASDRLAQENQLRERDMALARATRFAMLGEAASGLAHELNQPIMALVSYLRAAQILAAPLDNQDTRLIKTLDKAAREAIRTSDVLRRVRDFYRGTAPKLTAVNLVQVITTVLERYKDVLHQLQVELELQVDSNLPPIHGDRTQLEMVLLNILSNAIDALSTSGLARRTLRLSAGTRDGEAFLCIEDSGPGVASEVSNRMFEPFVTSKSDGMGLGLAITRSLLRSHGGDVSADRSALGGARFTIRIPMTPARQVAI